MISSIPQSNVNPTATGNMMSNARKQSWRTWPALAHSHVRSMLGRELSVRYGLTILLFSTTQLEPPSYRLEAGLVAETGFQGKIERLAR